MWRLGVLSLLFFIILMEDKIDCNLKIGGGLVFLNWDLVMVWLGNLIKFIFIFLIIVLIYLNE